MTEKRRGVYFNQGGMYGSPLPSGLERLRLPNNPQVIIPETVKRNGITDVKPGDNNDILPSPIPVPSILWTPSDITTALWLDASDANTITESGGDVSGWGDKSGNTRDMIQGTALGQPTTDSVTINGLNAIYFDGQVERMNTSAGATWLNNTVFTIFAVSLEHTYQTQNIMLSSINDVDDSLFAYGRGGEGSIPQWDFLTVGGGTASWDSLPAGFDPLLSVTQFQNTGSQHWMFGTDYGTATNPANAISAITEPLNIGLHAQASFNYAGSVAEMAIVTGSMTLVDRQKMEGYLAWKWGLVDNLPSDHPYKDAPPTV
jgi:hypothetical protein